MSLLGILFIIVFFALLIQAIFETIWGVILILNGIFWHSIGYTLNGIAFVVGIFETIIGSFRKKATTGNASVACGFARVYGSSK